MWNNFLNFIIFPARAAYIAMATAAPPDSGVVPRGPRPSEPVTTGSRPVGSNSHAAAGVNGTNGTPVVQPKSVGQIGVSASVGHDHWANDVLSAVQDHRSSSNNSGPNNKEEAAAAIVHKENGIAAPLAAAVASTPQQQQPQSSSGAVGLTSVKELIREKKRKFHCGRMLELKNLPDGCTEQVGRPLPPSQNINSPHFIL